MNGTGDVLLDTSIVIEYLRNRPPIHERLQSAATLYLPLAVVGELLYGAFKSQNAAKETKAVKEFCRGCAVLLPDEATAENYAHIKVELAAAGTPIPQNDIWIAAAARVHALPLVTRDKHFSLIKGLAVLAW